MNRMKLMVVAIFLAASTVAYAESEQHYGGAEDVAFAQKLWVALEDVRLTGPHGVYSAPYAGKPPHGAFLETMTGVVEMEGELLPVIVQRNYAGNQINRRAVADDPEKWLHAVSVMLKREGYAPKGKDWFWASYAPDGALLRDKTNIPQAGKVAQGSSKGCIACHVMAPGGDMVFNHNRFAKEGS